MEMSEKLKQLLVTAVVNNVRFPGRLMARQYTVQDFFSTTAEANHCSYETVTQMYRQTEKALSSLPAHDPFEDVTSPQNTELQFRKDVLLEVGLYLKAQAAEAAAQEQVKKDAHEKAKVIRRAKVKNEYADLLKKTPEELAEELRKLETIVSA